MKKIFTKRDIDFYYKFKDFVLCYGHITSDDLVTHFREYADTLLFLIVYYKLKYKERNELSFYKVGLITNKCYER